MQVIEQIAIVLYVIFASICYFVCQHTINKQRVETFVFLQKYSEKLEDYSRRIQEEIDKLKKQLSE